MNDAAIDTDKTLERIFALAEGLRLIGSVELSYSALDVLDEQAPNVETEYGSIYRGPVYTARFVRPSPAISGHRSSSACGRATTASEAFVRLEKMLRLHIKASIDEAASDQRRLVGVLDAAASSS